MNDWTQVPFEEEIIEGEIVPYDPEDFASNPQARVAVVLLLDTSYSMSGEPIDRLNEGLRQFKEELMSDELASMRVEIEIITFGGQVRIVSEFTTAEDFQPEHLHVEGHTPMGEAILEAIQRVNDRKNVYRSAGIQYYRPWIFMITDGAPTDNWQDAGAQILQGEEAKRFMFFGVGVRNADFNLLKQISVRDPLKLDGLRFRDLFSWLSSSLQSVSHSNPGDVINLPPTTGPNGWAVLD